MAKQYLYHPSIVPDFDNEAFATSTVSLNCEDLPVDVGEDHYDGQKFTVAIKRELVSDHDSFESLSDALKERWNLDLQGVIDKFYSAACFTAAVYKTEEALKYVAAGNLNEAHKVAQDSIDQYQFNVRKKGTGATKAEVQEVKALKDMAAGLGMTLEDFIAPAKSMAENGSV